MTPLLFVVAVFLISVVAGFLGALLGLGGGLIVVPALTLLFHVDIRLAIGASIISVIATSSGAAAAYVRDRLANLRVAMFLEIGATAGAITGAWIAGILHHAGRARRLLHRGVHRGARPRLRLHHGGGAGAAARV